MKAKEGDLVDKQPSDSELMERVKSGDKDALLILTERWRVPAEQFAYSLMKNIPIAAYIINGIIALLAYQRILDKINAEE